MYLINRLSSCSNNKMATTGDVLIPHFEVAGSSHLFTLWQSTTVSGKVHKLYGGFLKWGYHHSWFLFLNGTSHLEKWMMTGTPVSGNHHIWMVFFSPVGSLHFFGGDLSKLWRLTRSRVHVEADEGFFSCLDINIWWFSQMGGPQNEWFIMGKSYLNRWFRGTPMSGNFHINSQLNSCGTATNLQKSSIPKSSACVWVLMCFKQSSTIPKIPPCLWSYLAGVDPARGGDQVGTKGEEIQIAPRLSLPGWWFGT